MVLVIIFFYFSFDFRLLVKDFIDTLVLGFSNAKAYALLFYILIYFFFSGINFSLPFVIKRWWLVLLSSLLFGMSLGLHIWFVLKHDLGLFDKATIVSHIAFSGNHLTHLHLFKPVLVALGLPFGLGGFNRSYENGFPIFSILPHWPYYIAASLFFIFIILLLFYWIQE